MKTDFPLAIGFSVPHGDLEAAARDISADVFSGAEVPGEFIMLEEDESPLESCGLQIVHATSPFSPSLTRSIAEQEFPIVEDFMESFRAAAGRMRRRGCGAFSADFGIDSSILNPQRRELRVKLMKRLAPILMSEKVRLCIPARIPNSYQYPLEEMLSFLRDTMCGEIRFSVNIHVHESGGAAPATDLLRWFRFHAGVLRLVYEPETGNVLVGKMLELWFDAFKKLDLTYPVVFCPKVTSVSSFIREIERISALVKPA